MRTLNAGYFGKSKDNTVNGRSTWLFRANRIIPALAWLTNAL
jgi:hypothetical protein